MGREIKRVALDFDYPINKMIWKGYHNPYRGLPCKACNESGYSPEAKEISDNWYAHTNPEKRWCAKITQDEVEALFNEGRLRDFKTLPTAEEVNKWSRDGHAHDAINKWICVEARFKRLGITNPECQYCGGEGQLWPDEKYKELADAFEFIEPPAGEGYQLWCTTTEGTPMSPVFATPEELATWLVENNASSFAYDTATYEEWLKFIKGPGWAMTMVMDSTGIHDGVKYCSVEKENEK